MRTLYSELLEAPLPAEILGKPASSVRDSVAEMLLSGKPTGPVTRASQSTTASPSGGPNDTSTVSKRMTRAAAKQAQSPVAAGVTTNEGVVSKKASPSPARKRRKGNTKWKRHDLIIIDDDSTSEKNAGSGTPKRRTETVDLDPTPVKKARSQNKEGDGTLRNSKSGSNATPTASKAKRILKTKTDTLPMLPNRYILRDGNTTSFWYTLRSGSKIAFSQWNVYNTSLSRLLNEDALTVCADMVLRELKIEPRDGYEWMHETLFLQAVFGCKEPNMDKFALQVPRWKALLGSKTLFVPIFRNKHWSLLTVSNCSSILNMILNIKPSAEKAVPLSPIQIVAAHFDSLAGIGHAEHLQNIKLILTAGILRLWKHKYRDVQDAIPPNVKGIVESSVIILQAKVEQQLDGVSCGWRTIRHANFVAENGVDSAPRLKNLAVNSIQVEFRDMAEQAIAKVLNLSKPSSTDIPTLLYPLHSLVDHAVLSFFEATPQDLATKVASYLVSEHWKV